MLSSECAVEAADGGLDAHHHTSMCLGVMLLCFAFVIRGSLCSLISTGCERCSRSRLKYQRMVLLLRTQYAYPGTRICLIVFFRLRSLLVTLVWTCPIAGMVGTSGWIDINPSDILPPRLTELRGPLSIKTLAAICALTTFTDWNGFSHPTLKLFKSSPLPFQQPVLLLFYPSVPVRITS